MADNKPLEVQEKKELVAKGEKTVPARYYMPNTDIRETEDALLVVMEVPGVDRKDVDIKVEEDTLSIEARIDYLEIRGHGAALHGVQCRPLRAAIRPVAHDRPAADRRHAERRRVDADVEEGPAGPATPD